MTGRKRRRWLMRFSGLAFRISFLVFGTALFASLVVTTVSVHSIGTFLQGEIARKFPDLLKRVSVRLDSWYAQRERDIAAFTQSEILKQSLGRGGGTGLDETSWFLSYVLARFPQYEALFLVDQAGESLLRVGSEEPLDASLLAQLSEIDKSTVSPLQYLDGHRIQVVSAPVRNGADERVATLHAVLRLEALEPLLHPPELSGSTMLQLVDHRGTVLGTRSGHPLAGVSTDLTAAEGTPEIIVTQDATGERIVASAIGLPRFGWTLVAVQAYDDAFAPISATVRRTLFINLLTVIVCSAGAFAFASWRVRPILALAEEARRLSEGETPVQVQESGVGDEIHVLARTFNQMATRLHESRVELESRNEELQRANETLEQLSITDSLTRLHNHRFFQDQFAREAKRAARGKASLCLVLMDIDDFKSLNDRLGHAAGDAVLERVARVMSSVLRETDVLCRYGGEEFALLSPHTDLPGAISLAEKIRSAVAESEYSILGPDGSVHITVSMGVAQYAHSTGETFNAADHALYEAKAAGKDCVVAAPFRG